MVIFIAIDPVELQPFGEFGSEADFVPPLRGELPYSHTGWTRFKQEQLRLAVIRWLQRVKELSFGLCHEKVT